MEVRMFNSAISLHRQHQEAIRSRIKNLFQNFDSILTSLCAQLYELQNNFLEACQTDFAGKVDAQLREAFCSAYEYHRTCAHDSVKFGVFHPINLIEKRMPNAEIACQLFLNISLMFEKFADEISSLTSSSHPKFLSYSIHKIAVILEKLRHQLDALLYYMAFDIIYKWATQAVIKYPLHAKIVFFSASLNACLSSTKVIFAYLMDEKQNNTSSYSLTRLEALQKGFMFQPLSADAINRIYDNALQNFSSFSR